MGCWNCYYIHFQNRQQSFKITLKVKSFKSEKLVTLLVLLCGQRCREILSVLVIRNLDLSENMRMIRPGDILKTFGPEQHFDKIKFYDIQMI